MWEESKRYENKNLSIVQHHVGGIFRNLQAEFIGCFSCHLGITTSVCAELIAAMFSIEIANDKGWSMIWLETDSTLVVKAFSSTDIVPWKLQSRWKNCMIMSKRMKLHVSHIFRERN